MKSSLLISAIAVTLFACGSQDAVVGGECRFGYTLSGDKCVTDSPTMIGSDSTPTSTPTASSTAKVASSPLGSSSSAESGEPSGQTGTGTGTVVTPPAPPVTTTNPPASTGPVCEDPTPVACHGTCIEVQDDPQNCGACGRVCPSNICTAGVCQGATPGDIVVIGHDMSQAVAGSTHAKVFGNAMTLPSTDPLRVLAFEADADDATIDKTRSLTFAATTRQVRFGSATPSMLADDTLYSQWDVILVDAVAGGRATELGTEWSEALSTFTKAGGVVVTIDNGSGDVPTFLRTTGLIDIGLHTTLADGTQFVVTAPNDTVGAHLVSPYAAYGTSWGFVGAEAPSANLAWVVESDDSNAYPTVIHKVAR